MKDTTLETFQLPSEKSPHKHGFAGWPEPKLRRVASLGGKAVPDEKRSFSQNKQLAVESGRKGGLSVPRGKRLFVIDPTAASRAGKFGGLARKLTGDVL